MAYDPFCHHRPRVFARGRRSIRLRGYDYARLPREAGAGPTLRNHHRSKFRSER
jgi:hypothetical protein